MSAPQIRRGETYAYRYRGNEELVTVLALFGRECRVRLQGGREARCFQRDLLDPGPARLAQAAGHKRRAPRQRYIKAVELPGGSERGRLERGEIPYHLADSNYPAYMSRQLEDYLFFWTSRYSEAKRQLAEYAPRQYQAWIYMFEQDKTAAEAARAVQDECHDPRATSAIMSRAYYSAKRQMRPVLEEWRRANDALLDEESRLPVAA